MADFMIERTWRDAPAGFPQIIRIIEAERTTQEPWRNLSPDMLTASTETAGSVQLDAVQELLAWLDRAADPVVEGLVRWTEDGRAAGSGMSRIALRYGTPTTLWVGGPDQSQATGMAALLVRALDAAESTGAASQPGTGGPAEVATLKSSQRLAPKSVGNARRIVQSPWVQLTVTGVAAAVIGGLILAWLTHWP